MRCPFAPQLTQLRSWRQRFAIAPYQGFPSAIDTL